MNYGEKMSLARRLVPLYAGIAQGGDLDAFIGQKGIVKIALDKRFISVR